LINITVANPDELAQVRKLFSEYASAIDLSFKDSDREVATLPGEYAPPTGCILLAKKETEVVGCVALRRINEDVCEMKKLYVKPAFRETSIGRRLSEAVIGEARARGYRIMKLAMISSMRNALRLYESLGFRKAAPYSHPVKGAVFMQLDLTTSPFS
jgi:putative acetyltransferase